MSDKVLLISISMRQIFCIMVVNFRNDCSEWHLPNYQSKCKWSLSKSVSESPHDHRVYSKEIPKIMPDVLHHIGNTPLIKINKIAQSEGLKCELRKF